MQTTSETRSIASYAQTQTFSSTSSSTSAHKNVSVNQKSTETSQMQQYSRSSEFTSKSASTHPSTTGMKGINVSVSVSSTSSHAKTQNAYRGQSGGKERCGSQKSCYEKSSFGNDKSHCGTQKNSWSSTHIKVEDKHCVSTGGKKNSSINTQVKIDQKCSVSQSHSFGGTKPGNNNGRGCDQKSNWTNTEVKDNKASIDLGRYKVDLNKSNSSLLLTNQKTGEKTKIWGDPHIETNGTSATFNGSMTFNLPDRTKITVGTQAKGCVSYADQVTITRGNSAYVVNGLSQVDSNALTVERTRGGRQLDRQTPDGFSLVANSGGSGWINPLTGRAPTASDFRKA